MKHVILGAGPAGVTAAETIRRNAPGDQITLIAGEPEPPYSRMAIPYLLEGKIGERIWNMERDFNNRAGFSSKDDTLPKRLLEEAAKTGPAKGLVNRLGDMLPEYYQLRGWDTDGVPTAETRKRLGL